MFNTPVACCVNATVRSVVEYIILFWISIAKYNERVGDQTIR